MDIGCLEPSVHRAEKDHIARSCNGSAPYWEMIFDDPHGLALNRVPRRKFAAVSPRAGIHAHVCPYVWRACDVVSGYVFLILTKIVMRDVDQSRARGKRRGLPVLCAG